MRAKIQHGRRIPEVLTATERTALYAAVDTSCQVGLRNLCLLRLMADAGFRVSEAISLKVDHVNLDTGRLFVRSGKGGKDRVLWLSDDDLKLLEQWQKDRPTGSPFLFPTLKGDRHVYDVYMRQVVKRLARKAGLTKNIHPHSLRHTFATDLYRETKNLRLVQKALGHSDISTTMIYTHLVDDELEEALKHFRAPRRETTIQGIPLNRSRRSRKLANDRR